jgi:hypothetical protein
MGSSKNEFSKIRGILAANHIVCRYRVVSNYPYISIMSGRSDDGQSHLHSYLIYVHEKDSEAARAALQIPPQS